MLNLGLLIALALPQSDPQVAEIASGLAESGSFRSSESYDAGGYAQHYATLRAAGWSDEETKPMLLARLEMEARRAAAVPEPQYWQPPDASRFEFPLRLHTELGRVRETLLEVYGADAVHDPAFSTAFRPLGPEFSFLTSEDQIEVQQVRLKQQLSAVRASTGAMPFANQGQLVSANEVSPKPRSAAAPFRSELAAVLDEGALFEYRLRESALAEQLRGSGVEYTEEEFRETFRILDRLEQSMGDRQLYATSRRELRALLGSRRFALLWAGRDPLFGVIKQACVRHSLTDETVLTVYELFNNSQDRLIEVTQAAAGDPQGGAENAREEREDLRRRLAGLVGDDVAEDILSAQTEHILRLMNSERLVPQ